MFSTISRFVLVLAFLLALAWCLPSAAAESCCPGGGSCAKGGLAYDFETGDLQGWAVACGKFGKLVSDREKSRNVPNAPYPKQGKYYLSTTELPDGGYDDGMTGIVVSPMFRLCGPKLTLMVGGGSGPDTYVALCAPDGRELRTASGANAEAMTRVEWDVAEYAGKTAYLALIDNAKGSWGNISLDDVHVPGELVPAEMPKESLETRAAAREARLADEKKVHQAYQVKRREELLSEDLLYKQGEARVYSGDHLGSISLPVGGIAAGCIQMDGKARMAVWQIFNNHQYVTVPNTFFALRVKQDGDPVVRALQTEAVGPFAPMPSLSFRGEYPFGWYDFEDAELPVKASMEVFSPLVPMDLRDSAMPGAVFNITVRNISAAPADVSLLASARNAVGMSGRTGKDPGIDEQYDGNANTIFQEDGVACLEMTSALPANAPGHGSMALAGMGAAMGATAAYESTDALMAAFNGTGALSGATSAKAPEKGKTIDGALAAPFTLKPGESRTVTFVLAWNFPNVVNGAPGWGGAGNHYTVIWPTAMDTAREMCARLAELTEKTRGYHDALYDSNLPRWLIDRVSSQVAVLRARTCFWTRDGYFGGYEGCGGKTGCCEGNCTHVWHYAQAHARLFPELARKMRDQDFQHQHPDGGVQHRHLPNVEPATDGQFGTILGAWREYQTSTDRAWIDAQWPAVKKAMEYTIKLWDADEDGALAGRQWNTLDDALGGSTTWMGSLYLASLNACEELARLEGDNDLAGRYLKIRLSGAKIQDQTLFNGEYYIQMPDAEPRKDYNDGCAIDQLLGQWWACQTGLGRYYPEDHMRSAMNALFNSNFRASFYGVPQLPRKFADDPDAGLQMICWPKGGKPADDHRIFYADEVMTGFEYSAAAMMIEAGLMREGFAVARGVYERYDGRLRTGLTAADTASWGYSGNPFGDDECGKFYARAMSSWSLLTACQGFQYNGPEGRIGFKPVWKPGDHRSFFTVAEGWGVFSQKRGEEKLSAAIDLRYGKLKLNTIELHAGSDWPGASVAVRVGDRAVSATASMTGPNIVVKLAAPLQLAEGDKAEIELTATK